MFAPFAKRSTRDVYQAAHYETIQAALLFLPKCAATCAETDGVFERDPQVRHRGGAVVAFDLRTSQRAFAVGDARRRLPLPNAASALESDRRCCRRSLSNGRDHSTQ